ncbi:AAA family ATPase [Actinoplanes sp. NPDC049681]|uniref:AAA family ATPase n=1 Tax=Actinoplanes sp. NPDC049681 TaxID=3363905 RepID=UPI00379727C7
MTTPGFAMHRPGSPAATATAEPETPVLDPQAKVDIQADEAAARVREVLAAVDSELVGLAGVKRRIREIAALLMVDRARARFGLSASRPSLHMSFAGGPGTGKTTVALRMAEILHALGYLRAPRVHPVTRDDLVGQFIGHTAPKTKEALARAAGGVLFIDEAYYLYRPDNERDYGQEAIEILLQEMESARASLVVIFAGYEDRMETFFSSNPGLSSRVAHHIQFEDYATDELAEIAELMLTRDDYCFTEAGRAAFLEYLERRRTMPRFANARSVRNALERARLRQANRLVALPGQVGRDDLMLITEEDIRRSRIFAATPEGA